MGTALTVAGPPNLPALPTADIEKAADLARQEKAKATRRAYRSDFEIFRAWCTARGVSALPATAESVAAFLAREVDRGIRPSTIGRRVAAIGYAHKLAGHAVPTDDERVARHSPHPWPSGLQEGAGHRRAHHFHGAGDRRWIEGPS